MRSHRDESSEWNGIIVFTYHSNFNFIHYKIIKRKSYYFTTWQRRTKCINIKIILFKNLYITYHLWCNLIWKINIEKWTNIRIHFKINAYNHICFNCRWLILSILANLYSSNANHKFKLALNVRLKSNMLIFFFQIILSPYHYYLSFDHRSLRYYFLFQVIGPKGHK